ncbi:hypothetical protein GDO78_009027, partial [Eleutherodactylus coqui]
LNILVDTGSSNFAVAGASNPYITSYYLSERSKTYRPLNLDVTVRYTQGSWTGVLGQDVVTLPKGLNGTFLVNIASILESESFFMPDIKWQGILGLAYRALAKPSSAIDTFFDSLVEQQKIPNIFSMQMCGAGRPTTLTDSNGGSLVMGGMEPSLYRGEIWYTPITEEWYYQVEVLKFEVGGQNLNLDCTEYNLDKAIVDSGTTLLRLPDKVFNAVVDGIIQTSLLYIQSVVTSRTDLSCYRFGISPSSNALVIGATVMEGFYVVFDREEKRVGFATSSCAVVGDVMASEISGPFSTVDISSNCIASNPLREPIMWIISYTLMTFCGIVLLVLVVLLLLPNRRHINDPEVVNDESSLVRHRWK